MKIFMHNFQATGFKGLGLLKSSKSTHMDDLLLLLFSHWVLSDSLQPHGLQHSRLCCPPRSSRVCLNSCPLSRWCYLNISSSAAPFSFFFPSFPASESFPMSHLFALVVKVLELQLQHQYSSEYSGLISLDWLVWSPCSPRDSQESTPVSQFETINSSALSLLYDPTLTSTTTEKIIALTWWAFVSKVMSLLFNMLSRSVITFLPRRKHLLILCLQSPSAVILESKIIKSATASTFSPSIYYEVIWPDTIILDF